MTQNDATPETAAQFLTPARLAQLSPNQQTYAATIINDFLATAQIVAPGPLTGAGITATLAALPATVDREHRYYVAVIPVLTAYVRAQHLDNQAELLASLTQARAQLVAKHTVGTVDEQQRAYEAVVAKVTDWVQALHMEPQVRNLTVTSRRYFDEIIHVVAELLITGKQLTPENWDQTALAAVMFGPFTQLVDEPLRVAELYQLIPFALSTLFEFLDLPQKEQLQGWVRRQHTALTTMYDPQMNAFFNQITAAMRRQGIDTQDKAAVARFTQQYLRRNPALGQKLFATDQQLSVTHKQHRLARHPRRRQHRR